MRSTDVLTVAQTAQYLAISPRHVRRLVADGTLTSVARGVVDRHSVDRHLSSQRHGRTRSWAEHTAWGAIALLADMDPDWLGETQRSRLRRALRETGTVDELFTRLRDRARVHTFAAHRAALPRLRALVMISALQHLGIGVADPAALDGYLRADDLPDIVHRLGLREDPAGNVVLRVTGFDHEHLALLIDSPVVSALDAGTHTDPRINGVGRRALQAIVTSYR